jgi:hypothetical protein
LDLTEHFMLYLAVTLVLEPLNAWPETADELAADLKRIWEEEQFTAADLRDFGRWRPV